MKLLLTLVLFLCCVDLPAYSNEDHRTLHDTGLKPAWNYSLQPMSINVNTKNNTGRMTAYWTGENPYEYYENLWLPFLFTDEADGRSLMFFMWITDWSGTCKPPCEVQVDFITKDVKWLDL